MNIAGGVARLQRAGRTLMLGPLGIIAVLLLLVFLNNILSRIGSHVSLDPALGVLMLMAIYCGTSFFGLGIILWLAGWILEGFAEPKS